WPFRLNLAGRQEKAYRKIRKANWREEQSQGDDPRAAVGVPPNLGARLFHLSAGKQYRSAANDGQPPHRYDERRKRVPALRRQGREKRAREGGSRRNHPLAHWLQPAGAREHIERRHRLSDLLRVRA